MTTNRWFKWVLIIPGIAFIIYLIFYFLRNRHLIEQAAHRQIEAKYPELDPEKHKEDYDEAKKQYEEKVKKKTSELMSVHADIIEYRFDRLFGRT